jgi:hypothetical protein
MHTTSTDPTTCPSHLTTALAAATSRWDKQTNSCRAWQAAEVLRNASELAESRGWDSSEALHEAELGLWLLRLARHEDATKHQPQPQATPSAAGIEEFRRWKAAQAKK